MPFQASIAQWFLSHNMTVLSKEDSGERKDYMGKELQQLLTVYPVANCHQKLLMLQVFFIFIF